MTIAPAVTVLMPVFNAAPFLAEAVDSVLAQSYRDFELLIVDDGSTDASAKILSGFHDPRVRLVRNEANTGIVCSLNRGLKLAEGTRYIARMDADDISLPARLERQVAFMDAHPEVGVCGTWLESFGAGLRALWSPPCDDDAIRCSLLFESVLYHPTIVFRRSLLDRHAITYSAEFPHAEDYELWSRLSDICSCANIAEVLLHYRLHRDNIGFRESKMQGASADGVRLRLLASMGVKPDTAERATHAAVSSWRVPLEGAALGSAHDWLLKLVRANRVSRRYPQQTFERTVARRWFQICLMSTPLGLEAWRLYNTHELGVAWPLSLRHRAGFFVRALLRRTP